MLRECFDKVYQALKVGGTAPGARALPYQMVVVVLERGIEMVLFRPLPGDGGFGAPWPRARQFIR